MKILFLYNSLKLGGSDWNTSMRLCSALERHHRVAYAYQIVEQDSWHATKDASLRAELIGAQQFLESGFDCLIIDGRTHEDPDFSRVPSDTLREFSGSGGAVIFLFSDFARLLDGRTTVDCINELTGVTGLIHTLFVHPSGSIVRGCPDSGSSGLISLDTDQAYLARFERYVTTACYANVRRLLVNNPLYLLPVFDALCAGDRHTMWVTTHDTIVDTMRSAPPAFASMLRRNSVTVFMTGDIWRDYLSEQSPDNVVFVDNVVLYAEQYQRERRRKSSRPGVFVSYSHADRDLAMAISRALERNGAEVWLDEKMMPFGSSISESCEAGIRRSDKVLFLITPDSLRSDWVRFEFDTAVSVGRQLARQRLIIPVVFNVTYQELIADLPEIHDIKYLTLDADLDDVSDEVVESILR